MSSFRQAVMKIKAPDIGAKLRAEPPCSPAFWHTSSGIPRIAGHRLQGLRGAATDSVLSLSQPMFSSLPPWLCLSFLRNPSQSAAVVSDFCRLKENPGAGESFLGRSKSQPNIKEIL